jgi:hypothetical protein
MAQFDRALFLYGLDVTDNNKYVNFKTSNLGNEITAVLNIGNYTCTQFMAELKRAVELADGTNTYIFSLDRTINSGSSNRMHVTTSGSYLDILFGTGTNSANSPAVLMGFSNNDYTGSTTYTGFTNAGNILYPDFPTYDYLGPDDIVTNDGVKNISASGIKETIVFAQMYFFQGQWKYVTDFGLSTQKSEWQTFLKYATKQLKFEFEPSVQEDPDVYYQCTLESTPGDSNGMGYRLSQMRGEGLYRFYDTGVMKFRVIPS